MKYAYAISTWSGARIVETIQSVPKGSRLLIVDNSQQGWPLAKSWNYAMERLLVHEKYDAVIIMNDDVVLRSDTGELLAWALLYGQFEQGYNKELLLISARHANHGDMFTDVVNWDLMNAKEPRFEPGPDFSCFCTTRKLVDIVGPFDEHFIPAYYEDNDMHRRIQLAGYEAYAYAPYWHYRSVTVRTDPERAREVTSGAQERCRQYYLQKWGGAPSEERFTTPFNRGVLIAK
jgi:hypothetical protein